MKKSLIIGLFCCLALAQIVTPLSMISKRESVLRYGEQFKFKTAPIDPYDAFRGRYVALRIEGDSVPLPKGTQINYGQSVYALIALDEHGFAKFITITEDRPHGEPYIQAKVRYISGGKAQLELPIDRYYMEESAAPAAERIYREHNRRDKQDAYVLVRIKDGLAVVEALYVAGERIEEVVKKGRKN